MMNYASPQHFEVGARDVVLTTVIPEKGGCDHICPGCVLGQESQGVRAVDNIKRRRYHEVLPMTIDALADRRIGVAALTVQGERAMRGNTWSQVTFPMFWEAAAQHATPLAIIDVGHELEECQEDLRRLRDDITIYVSLGGDQLYHDRTRRMRSGESSFALALKNLEAVAGTGLNIRISCMLMPRQTAPIIRMLEQLPSSLRGLAIAVHPHMKLGRFGEMGAPMSSTEQFLEDVDMLTRAAKCLRRTLYVDDVLNPMNLRERNLKDAIVLGLDERQLVRITGEGLIKFGTELLEHRPRAGRGRNTSVWNTGVMLFPDMSARVANTLANTIAFRLGHAAEAA